MPKMLEPKLIIIAGAQAKIKNAAKPSEGIVDMVGRPLATPSSLVLVLYTLALDFICSIGQLFLVHLAPHRISGFGPAYS